MPRAILRRVKQFAYHVTNRANNKEWFYIPPLRAWKILTESLANALERYESRIWTFVQMSNHFHAIILTPMANLDRVMQYFLTGATREIQKESGRINHIFGARYKWSVLDSPAALAYAYKYVYRNPVRAGICSRVEEYRYSTLTNFDSPLPLSEGFDSYWSRIPRNISDRLEWLNLPTPKEQEDLVGAALRRKTFQFSTNSNIQSTLRDLQSSYAIETSYDFAPAPFVNKWSLTPFQSDGRWP